MISIGDTKQNGLGRKVEVAGVLDGDVVQVREGESVYQIGRSQWEAMDDE